MIEFLCIRIKRNFDQFRFFSRCLQHRHIFYYKVNRKLITLKLDTCTAGFGNNFCCTAVCDMNSLKVILRHHARSVHEHADRLCRLYFSSVSPEGNIDSTNTARLAFNQIVGDITNRTLSYCREFHLCTFRKCTCRCHNAHNHSVGGAASEHFLIQSSLQLLVRSFFCFFRFRLRFRFGL